MLFHTKGDPSFKTLGKVERSGSLKCMDRFLRPGPSDNDNSKYKFSSLVENIFIKSNCF